MPIVTGTLGGVDAAARLEAFRNEQEKNVSAADARVRAKLGKG